MLKETIRVRQIEGEDRRRWFSDRHFDLIVWYDAEDHITGFQLCYDKTGQEHALTWKEGQGFFHQLVDDGENRAGRQKATPILLADGAFDQPRIAAQFRRESARMDQVAADFVFNKIMSVRP
jgi:hypothetical protein